MAVALVLGGLAQGSEPQLARTPRITLDDQPAWVQKSQGINAADLRQGIAIDPLTPSTLYAATWGAGLYKSIDSGASWQPINIPAGAFTNPWFIDDIAVDPAQEGTVYVAVGCDLSKSTDGPRSCVSSFSRDLHSWIVVLP